MDIKIYPTSFKGTLDMIGSKSLSHRYLIAASLSEKPSVLKNLMDSEDTIATISILNQMGAAFKNGTMSGPINKVPSSPLNAMASGSTLRFLIPLAMTFKESIFFEGKDRLPYRSLEAFKEAFESKDVVFKPLQKETWLPLEVKGPLSPGEYVLSGDISSQFVSGLLFVLPLLEGDSKIVLKNKITSLPYIEMTLNVLNTFNVHARFKDNQISIPGFQKYEAITKIIEGDYSHSVFFLSGVLLGGNITLNHLPQKSIQGDYKVLEILTLMGAKFSHNNETISIKRQSLKTTTMDLDDTPDLAPMLMALAAFIEGKSIFKGLSRLKHKESDRFQEMKKILTCLNRPFSGDETHFEIKGSEDLFEVNTPFDAARDHRIAMTLAMLAPKAKSPYIIKGFECINKSYPRFLEDYEKIGGRYEVLEEKI